MGLSQVSCVLLQMFSWGVKLWKSSISAPFPEEKDFDPVLALLCVSYQIRLANHRNDQKLSEIPESSLEHV